MPSDLACTGASTGNVCTVRCRNNALAGPFGGCFAVQQTDVTAAANNANVISTAQTASGIKAQVAENIVDLPVAIADNVQQGSEAAVAANAKAANLLAASVTTTAFPQQTQTVANVDAPAAGVAAATTSSTKKAKATKAAAAKNNKNNNKRAVLRWAERMVEAVEEKF